MSINEVSEFYHQLKPVNQAIAQYYELRPLNWEARNLLGPEGAMEIVRTEASELVQACQYGSRQDVQYELGDVLFGMGEYVRLTGNHEIGRSELLVIGGFLEWIKNIAFDYRLDPFQSAVKVVRGKNAKNYPSVFFRHHHPLDNAATTMERDFLVRAGLRAIRNLDEERVLRPENYGFALAYFGYTRESVKNPTLATAFLRQIVYEGMIN